VSAWPEAAWGSPWLEGIDAPSRALLEASGAVRRLAKGARVYGEGEPAGAFFVVTEGVVELRGSRRGERAVAPLTLRRAVAGDAVGEEALVRVHAPRRSEAICVTDAVVVEVPLAPFRRASARLGETRAKELESRLWRAAVRDALRASSLGAGLADEGLRALAAAADEKVLDRGDALVVEGEPVDRVFVVGDGMLQATCRESGEGKTSVRAYFSRGDVVSEEPSPAGHSSTLTACGPAWVLAIDRDVVERLAPVRGSRAGLRLTLAPDGPRTRHVTKDLWRFAVAGSMLIIDDEVCVRCGHCASSCAAVHTDGVSRLVRRGEKVAVHDAHDGSARALLLPGSCQHCRDPVCMRDCPTGAIRRDDDGGKAGSVSVREDLCVGCGACAKACPWGSVQMAPRSLPDSGRDAGPSALVAVKCDSCQGRAGGPACVSACPVEAIARIEPSATIAEVRAHVPAVSPPRPLPRKRSSAGWVLGAAFVALAAARTRVGSYEEHLWSGLCASVLLVLLAAYTLAKRAGWARVRPQARAHVVLGVLAVGVVAAHSGCAAPPNAAGALMLAFSAASLSGLAAAVVYRLVPAALSRIERHAALPEDLPRRARDLDERVFGLLTGRSDGAKAVYARILTPYARSRTGALQMAVAAPTLRDEERRVSSGLERILGARRVKELDGLEDLVRWAVERRANLAQRMHQGLLRGVLPAHVVAVAVTMVLLGVHVWCVARGR
jgi:Fe-S-cluster-containing dehydrogenase component/CRP-like cAMP-binding protein